LNTEPMGRRFFDPAALSSFSIEAMGPATDHSEGQGPLMGEYRSFILDEEQRVGSWLARYLAATTDRQFDPSWKELSRWSRSAAKRIFDCACVLMALPVLIPLTLAIGIAVRLSSPGPVLFLQERVGHRGRTFTIFKFRTMVHIGDAAHGPITTSDDQRFTRVGPFLRRWKLDELPQLANVLLGHMSLVGPRPKVPEHVMFDPPCRPGITGLATIVFAREEEALAGMDRERLDAYYHAFVLPAKRQLDAAYMARATFLSDLRLLVNSVLRRWDAEALDEFMATMAFGIEKEVASTRTPHAARDIGHMPISPGAERRLEAEEISAG
jgi:lipopolysaccharide/colanic/teichoic acid biosynthesis glycosyltransferase